MPLEPARRRQIEKIFREFLANRARTIRKLRIHDLDINPFLLRLLSSELNLNNAEAIVRWLVNQRLERGTVTSFGLALQNAAKVFSEGTGVEGADILKTKNGRHYHIQVKSGPNTVPKDLGVRIAQLLRSAQRRNKGSVALYGMCYGSKERVSSIVKKYVQEEGGIDWVSGREFWEFISGDPECLDEIYKIAADVGKTFKDKKGQSLTEVLAAKVNELIAEFVKIYGKSGNLMWEKLLAHNS
ncbi:MAG: PmeII family type II restriction endonuclease [Bacillota bacterium]